MQDDDKRLAAEGAIAEVRDGMIVGLGTGTTASYAIRALGERVRNQGLKISGVATSNASDTLARQYGIHGFCYYHYWFNGNRLLNAPVDAMLQSGKPDFPFMLCWANENWTRRWDGQDQEILIKQDYSTADDLAHIQFLLNNVFNDARYIRVNNKPFFLLYRPALFPDIKQTLATWRAEAAKAGMELYIGFMKTFGYDESQMEANGFDCAVDFQPHNYNVPVNAQMPLTARIKNKMGFGWSPYHWNRVFSYPEYVDVMLSEPISPNKNVYPGITPGWDNSARRTKGAFIYTGSTPAEYGRWLKHIADQHKGKDTFLFINAWNEWAEGNHLEPDAKWGRQYLEQTAKILKDA